MKVLVNRIYGLISSRLLIEAINYNWSVRSDYGLFVRLCKFLRINTFIKKGVYPVTIYINWNLVTEYNFKEILSSLSSSSLRSLIKLSEFILKRPKYFDIFIKSNYSISIKQFEKILCQGTINFNKIGNCGMISLLW